MWKAQGKHIGNDLTIATLEDFLEARDETSDRNIRCRRIIIRTEGREKKNIICSERKGVDGWNTKGFCWLLYTISRIRTQLFLFIVPSLHHNQRAAGWFLSAVQYVKILFAHSQLLNSQIISIQGDGWWRFALLPRFFCQFIFLYEEVQFLRQVEHCAGGSWIPE